MYCESVDVINFLPLCSGKIIVEYSYHCILDDSELGYVVLNRVSVVGAEVLVVGLLGHAFLTASKDCPGIETSHFGNFFWELVVCLQSKLS